MKKKKIVVSVLLVCLLCVNLVSMAVKAETTSTIHSVSSWYDFKDAVQYSQDGDIIVVHGEIDLGTDVKIGSSSRHLTIKRDSADSRIVFEYINEAVTNITFDGGGIDSPYSWITSTYETTFTNCTFKDFGNSENYSSSGSVGGAVKVQSGSCVFNDCTFENSYALAGGAIEIQGNSQVEINNCSIKNCGAVTCGGAIDNSSYAATCTITGGTITGNKANDFGGGVSNAGNTTITGTKVYANSAVNGGADVATGYGDAYLDINVPYTSDSYWAQFNDFDNVYVFSQNSSGTKEIAQEVKSLLEARHGMTGQDAFLIEDFESQMASVMQVLSMITIFIMLVAAISLLVGGIGVMNIMLVSVTERTREIGIRKALGARTKSILVQFLAESAIITGIGGVIGIVLGIGGAYAICALPMVAFSPSVSMATVLTATIFSCGVGIFFGIYPARKAAHLSPIEALRRN